MSKGPGDIESRIADLFAGTRDRALSVAEIADYAFEMGGGTPTRAQRLSATRAAHRLLRRIKESDARCRQLYGEARREAETAGAVRPKCPEFPRTAAGFNAAYEAARKAYFEAEALYDATFKATEPYHRAEALQAYVDRFGSWTRFIRIDRDSYRGESEFWRATADKNGTLYFHPPDVPVRIWAVDIQRAGVIWAEATVERITERNVSVRYAGEAARLDREKLWRHWALWRGVYFVSSRSGYAAQRFDQMWQDEYGRAYDEHGYANRDYVPPAMRMPLADAMALLGVPANFTKDDVLAAFRREVKKAHPDKGGTPEMFQKLVEARDRLLASIGTSAPVPKPPRYAPKGAQMVYRSVKVGGGARIGSTRRLSS
jgi:hypothetical protein